MLIHRDHFVCVRSWVWEWARTVCVRELLHERTKAMSRKTLFYAFQIQIIHSFSFQTLQMHLALPNPAFTFNAPCRREKKWILLEMTRRKIVDYATIGQLGIERSGTKLDETEERVENSHLHFDGRKSINCVKLDDESDFVNYCQAAEMNIYTHTQWGD